MVLPSLRDYARKMFQRNQRSSKRQLARDNRAIIPPTRLPARPPGRSREGGEIRLNQEPVRPLDVIELYVGVAKPRRGRIGGIVTTTVRDGA